MARPTNITLCSFCGKSHAEVKKLIAGPGRLSSATTASSSASRSSTRNSPRRPRSQSRAVDVPKPAEIKRQLDLACVGQDHAKKTLAVAVHNHYKRILQEPPAPPAEGEAERRRATRTPRSRSRRATSS